MKNSIFYFEKLLKKEKISICSIFISSFFENFVKIVLDLYSYLITI